jgi:hypothetical protein
VVAARRVWAPTRVTRKPCQKIQMAKNAKARGSCVPQ